MNWKQRAAVFLTEKGGYPLLPKPTKGAVSLAKGAFVSLVSNPGPPFEEIKNTHEQSVHAYHFTLRDGEGGGTYMTETNLDAARQELAKRYGDRLLLVTAA